MDKKNHSTCENQQKYSESILLWEQYVQKRSGGESVAGRYSTMLKSRNSNNNAGEACVC